MVDRDVNKSFKIKTGDLENKLITTEKLDTDSVIKEKIASGQVDTEQLAATAAEYSNLFADEGTETAVPDTDTDVAHGLGTAPSEVVLVPKTTGAAGYAKLSTSSATCITIQGSASGVDVDWVCRA